MFVYGDIISFDGMCENTYMYEYENIHKIKWHFQLHSHVHIIVYVGCWRKIDFLTDKPISLANYVLVY